MFPPLKLPPLSSRDALVLGSGPSFGDYDAEELQHCGATLYGAGDVSRRLRLDHYALGDVAAHLGNIPADPATVVHVTSSTMGHAEELNYADRARFRVTDPSRIYSGSSGNVALSLAVDHGHERVFVLGFDGLADSLGRARRRPHQAAFYSEAPGDPAPPSTAIPRDELVQLYVCRLLLQSGACLFSLTPHTVLPLPVPREIEEQPFAQIDRHGHLMIVMTPERGLASVLELATYWRRCHPRQAIVIVTQEPIPPAAPRDILYLSEAPSDAKQAEFNTVEVITFV